MTILVIALAVLGCGAQVAAAARRRELAARAAHELRGPLTAASLALHAGAAGAVQAQLERAAAAIDDLERAARGRTPALRSRPVDVAALLEQQAAAHRAAAQALGRQVRVLVPARHALVHVDPRMLRQAVANLIANALEHGSGDLVLAVRRRGGRVRLEVRDGGHGPRRNPGRRADLLRAGRHRRGHGLRFVATVAARHGGRLLLARDAHGFAAVLELPPAGPQRGGTARRRTAKRRRRALAA